MASPSFLQSLTSVLSPESRVLADEGSAEFKASMNRWTNYRLQVPSAIVQPATEKDVVTTVKELSSASIPFTPSSGGHSCFSSIGKEGVIIDLSLFTGVEVDETKSVATIKGGTLMKELQTVLHSYKQFAAVGSGNTVGVIPYYIGGGVSSYTPFYGYGCENIVAATLVTAQGELVQVNDDTEPELLWGIRGAGQFLGLITQLTIRIRPFSLLGNELGQRSIATFVFTADKVDAVCAAMTPIMDSKEYVSTGHMSVILAPPDFQHQALLVAPQVFATVEEAEKIFQPLVDLGPIMKMVASSTFETHSDHIAYLCATGSFKRFTQNGMTSFSPENFKELIKLHGEVAATCPDAARSGFTVEWHTPYKGPHVDTAFGLDDVQYWLNILSWYEDPKHHEYMESIDKKAQQIGRAGDKESEFISYTNTCREGPLEWRYKGQDRIARLKALKEKWDPKGVFTKELL